MHASSEVSGFIRKVRRRRKGIRKKKIGRKRIGITKTSAVT